MCNLSCRIFPVILPLFLPLQSSFLQSYSTSSLFSSFTFPSSQLFPPLLFPPRPGFFHFISFLFPLSLPLFPLSLLLLPPPRPRLGGGKRVNAFCGNHDSGGLHPDWQQWQIPTIFHLLPLFSFFLFLFLLFFFLLSLLILLLLLLLIVVLTIVA